MSKKYLLGMFVLCFCVWMVFVDNVVLPADSRLSQDAGEYTRYRVKKWSDAGKYDIIQNELLIYLVVENREQLYYMEYKPNFEAALKKLSSGTPVRVCYNKGFPKIWKRDLYSLNEGGIPIVQYSADQISKKQSEIWKFTGVMGGMYLILVVLGWASKSTGKLFSV